MSRELIIAAGVGITLYYFSSKSKDAGDSGDGSKGGDGDGHDGSGSGYSPWLRGLQPPPPSIYPNPTGFCAFNPGFKTPQSSDYPQDSTYTTRGCLGPGTALDGHCTPSIAWNDYSNQVSQYDCLNYDGIARSYITTVRKYTGYNGPIVTQYEEPQSAEIFWFDPRKQIVSSNLVSRSSDDDPITTALTSFGVTDLDSAKKQGVGWFGPWKIVGKV